MATLPPLPIYDSSLVIGSLGENLRLGFEVAPGDGAVIANVPETTNLGRVIRIRSNIDMRGVDAVDRGIGSIPRVDVAAQVAGLPTGCPYDVKGEGQGGGGQRRSSGVYTGGPFVISGVNVLVLVGTVVTEAGVRLDVAVAPVTTPAPYIMVHAALIDDRPSVAVEQEPVSQ